MITELLQQSAPATYTLEGNYGAPSSGTVTSSLQAAVTDILVNRGGGRLALQNRIYDFDSITWPSIGLDRPAPVLELLGAVALPTTPFMPGSGLTIAQGGDMPAPANGTILRSSQVSGSAFGGLSAQSNFAAIFRNVIVRVPPNPQQHGIDCGWMTNLVCDGVIVDQGRSWGNGTNPLSPGPIVQPTNTGVFGLVYPGAGNGGVAVARDLLVAGFYNALRHSEHFDGDRVTLAKNVVGLIPSDGYHAARIGRLSLYWNANGIQPVRFGGAGTPVTRLTIAEVDYEEDPVGGNWYTTAYHVNDPNNYLRGQLTYHREPPGQNPSFALAMRGAAYVSASALASPGTLRDAIGFEGADSATVVPSSWAGQAPAQRTGVWGISGQRAYIATPSGGNAGDQVVWDTGLTNLVLTCRVAAPNNTGNTMNGGLALFSVDAANWMAVFLVNSAGQLVSSIQKSDTSAWSNLSGNSAAFGTVVGRSEFDLQVTVIGKTISVYVDGVLRSAYTLTAAEWTKYSASTSHGFLAWTGGGGEPGGASGGRWDALRIEPARALAA